MSSVVLSKKGIDRLRNGQVWVFRSDVTQVDAAPGQIARIVDAAGTPQGYAFYGPSELSLRLLTREDKKPDRAFFKARIAQARARRERYFPASRDAMRVIHGEADMLPGWLVDKFGDALVVQSLSLASDTLEPMLIDLLIEEYNPRTVVVRDDGKIRAYENLPNRKGFAHGSVSAARYHEGDIAFEIDLLADQKTGAFLDQYDNHLIARDYARGAAVDFFCYHGGFGLQMAKTATQVSCVDQSMLAAGRTEHNAKKNGIDNLETLCANAFDVLRSYEEEGRRFDTIVIDPPAFAKRKNAVLAAYRGYKDLNVRALRCLNPGGILISCSCSAKMTRDLFEQMLTEAAKDARRKLLVLERRGASRDHPGLLGMVETEYLKCFVVQAI